MPTSENNQICAQPSNGRRSRGDPSSPSLREGTFARRGDRATGAARFFQICTPTPWTGSPAVLNRFHAAAACVQPTILMCAGRGVSHAVQLHRRAGGFSRHSAAFPHRPLSLDRSAQADGDGCRLGSGQLEEAERGTRPHRGAHPGRIWRPGFWLRRARHRAGGNGPGAAVRALFLVGRAGRDRHSECWNGRAEAQAPALDRHRRHHR